MPKINVYLPDGLAEAVKEAGVPVSAVCQHALELAVRRVTATREIISGGLDADAAQPDGALAALTPRAYAVLQDAQQRAQDEGAADMRTGHVLTAMLAEGSNLALRVLTALDIEPATVQRELDRRARRDRGGATPAAPPVAGQPRAVQAPEVIAPERAMAERASPESASPPLSGHAVAALEFAVNESTGLGNNYIGTEHLLLGLVAERDGVAGQVLRGLGAELRVTRRAVAAALAGYKHHMTAQGHASGGGAAGGPADALSAALDERLQPIMARLEQLERRAG